MASVLTGNTSGKPPKKGSDVILLGALSKLFSATSFLVYSTNERKESIFVLPCDMNLFVLFKYVTFFFYTDLMQSQHFTKLCDIKTYNVAMLY